MSMNDLKDFYEIWVAIPTCNKIALLSILFNLLSPILAWIYRYDSPKPAFTSLAIGETLYFIYRCIR